VGGSGFARHQRLPHDQFQHDAEWHAESLIVVREFQPACIVRRFGVIRRRVIIAGRFAIWRPVRWPIRWPVRWRADWRPVRWPGGGAAGRSGRRLREQPTGRIPVRRIPLGRIGVDQQLEFWRSRNAASEAPGLAHPCVHGWCAGQHFVVGVASGRLCGRRAWCYRFVGRRRRQPRQQIVRNGWSRRPGPDTRQRGGRRQCRRRIADCGWHQRRFGRRRWQWQRSSDRRRQACGNRPSL
jgi:hypothetical protein